MRNAFIKFLTGVILLPAISLPVQAQESLSSKNILDNGLTVVMTEMSSSPVVSVYALVKTGSATEGKFLGTGISHFLEHMLFKGTHGRGVGQLAARIQSVGGQINAATGLDYTIYTITVPHQSFDVALDVLSDMLMNSTINAEEVELERNVILNEMRLHNDNPDRKLNEIVFRNTYLRHPYRYPIIGYETLLKGVTQSDLVEYYKEFYSPNNTIISIAGNVEIDRALANVQKAFKDFTRRRLVVRNLPIESQQISSRRYEEEYPTELTRLSISFPSVNLLHHDLYALDVLAEILGQGRSSRLYENLYQRKRLVYSVSASNYTPGDKGIFGIDCLLEEGNVDKVIPLVLDHIEQIKNKGVTQGELNKAKQQVKSGYIFRNQTSASVAHTQAIDEAFSGDHQFSQKYVEAIQQVTNNDIKRVANFYLVETGLTTAILKPEGEHQAKITKQQHVSSHAIRKYTLDNGLTVLLREDKTFPVVSIRLSVNGGVRQEPAGLSGLSKITAATWIKGTKRYTSSQIALKTENLGLRLSSFSGRNSFGLGMELLSKDLPTALDLLEEFVFDPSFPDDEIVKVKENIRAVIRQREDDIFAFTSLALRETLFHSHPFRLNAEGTLVSIEEIQRNNVIDFYNRFSVPGNMVLSVFGDVNSEEVLANIREKFKSLENQEVDLKLHAEQSPVKMREKEVFIDKEQAMVMFGFQGVKVGDPDYYGLEVVTSILGSSFNGRLFTNIRDQLGEAYTLGGQFIPGPDAGLIYFYALTTESQVEEVKELLKKEIKKLHAKRVSDKELNDIKTYLKGSFRAGQETSSSLSFTVSLDELYGLGFENYLQYDSLIDQVTADDVQKLAQRYLNLNKSAVVVTWPQNNSDK